MAFYDSEWGSPFRGAAKCFNCNQMGHFARECPHPVVAKDSRLCHNCGEEGHTAAHCPHPKEAQQQQQDRPPVVCYNCGEVGHMARDCKKASTKQRVQGACYKCNRPGHMARECPYVSDDQATCAPPTTASSFTHSQESACSADPLTATFGSLAGSDGSGSFHAPSSKLHPGQQGRMGRPTLADIQQQRLHGSHNHQQQHFHAHQVYDHHQQCYPHHHHQYQHGGVSFHHEAPAPNTSGTTVNHNAGGYFGTFQH